ncbi:hypothetical protein QQF64_034442 [Cirrhinus molitorella]|uniref:C-type lectin domain-containing protein n=1 Tax=Cirrhinus molitorella TaxID=172907 RepID=A0ABR3L1B4_9TELE
MSWSESRQYCRDHGADLVIINSEEKQRHISSLIKESVWIGLSDRKQEGSMKWVDDSPLNQGFWGRGFRHPTTPKGHPRNFRDTIGPQIHCRNEGKARHRERRILMPITVCLGMICLLLIAVIILQHCWAVSKRGYLWGPDGLFMNNELMSWSESRQYCRDHGADLVIINSEEKQRHISSLIKESMWIGLSDRKQEGSMKWVDDSPLNQGFWGRAYFFNVKGQVLG